MSETTDATGQPWTRCRQCGNPEHGSIPCNLASPPAAVPSASPEVNELERRWREGSTLHQTDFRNMETIASDAIALARRLSRTAAVPGVEMPDWLRFDLIAERMRRNGHDPHNCTLSDCLLAARKVARAALSAAPGLPAPGPGQRDGSCGLPRTGTASLSDVEHRGDEKP